MSLFKTAALSLLAVFFTRAHTLQDFGYTECTYNSYEALCTKEDITESQENRGLRVFPVLTRNQTCVKLRSNAIERFPSDLNNLKTVATLGLADNRIRVLPDDMTVLSKLEILDLSRNGLNILPITTRFPNSLRGLLLSGNGMTTLPAGLQIPGLFVLDLSRNQFRDFPRHFCVSDQLIRVDLTNNPLNQDLSKFIYTVNQCKNTNNIPFCLFTDNSIMKCDCSSVGPILGGKPSFCLGTTVQNKEIECSDTGSDELYSRKKLFDINQTTVRETCPAESGLGLHSAAESFFSVRGSLFRTIFVFILILFKV